ncbi:MAG: hypothetical protein RL139_1065 [Gemmatimonadota bacterium]|jgi:hypothetical protein
MTTTFRADVAAGLVTILEAFQTANPTSLRSVHRARPEGFTGDYPIAFVEGRAESITHTSGVRTRTMTPSVSVVGEYRLNGEHMDEFDALVDALVDHFTASPHVVTGTIWDQMSVEDYDEQIGEQLRPAVRFTFGNLSIQEGRT